jgi:UDP-glucose:(glucosyl)LPS alpha-1,3-glucosyltransferase
MGADRQRQQHRHHDGAAQGMGKGDYGGTSDGSIGVNADLNNPASGARAGAAPFHIAFGVDTYYFRGMGVTMTSVIENNPGVNFVFHVFAFTISDDNRNRLRQLEAKYGVTVNIHIIDPSVFDECAKFPSFAHYSAAIFTRLLIPGTLKGVTDKVLYLDSDILCLGSIAELISMDLRDDIVALIHDNGEETVRNQCERLKLREKKYFNSGVLYINIDNWLANDITPIAMRTILESEQRFMFPDQDALNIVLDGRARFIDGKFNFQYNLDNCLKAGDPRMSPVGDAVFVHFTGRVKPWHDWSLHEAKSLFVKYQSLSPWADIPLDAPRNYKEMRMFSQFLAKQGRSAYAALWYLKYLVTKFSPKPAHKSL